MELEIIVITRDAGLRNSPEHILSHHFIQIRFNIILKYISDFLMLFLHHEPLPLSTRFLIILRQLDVS
jgi:hypothetical protein